MSRIPCAWLSTIALALVLTLFAAGQLQAQPLPSGINLGFTSFLDGGPPAGPGFYYQQYFQYYHTQNFRDRDGDRVPFPDLDVFVSLNQFIYQSDQPLLLGGKWGIDLIVPLVLLDADNTFGPLTDNGAGVGDILVGPFLQWDPIMGEQGPRFMHRVEFQVTGPTGRYSSDEAFNPGAHVWTFNPYWAGTLWITPQWTASTRIHYLWVSENDDPWIGFGPGVRDVQPGQAIHLNFASSVELLPKQLRAGLNGYFLQQITDARVNGSEVSGSRERVLGLGPGVLYSFSADDHLFLNLYWETAVENRTQGFRLVFRWTHHF